MFFCFPALYFWYSHSPQTKKRQMMLVLFLTYLWAGIFGGQDADHNCLLEYKKGCVSKIISNFEENIVKQDKEFTVYYNYTIPPKEEPIAECDWVQSGNFDCRSAKSFTCDKHLTKNFSLWVDYETKCLQQGEFKFDVKDVETIRCKVSPNVTREDDFNDGPTNLKEKEANGKVTGIIIGVICSCLVVVVAAAILVRFLRNRGHPKYRKRALRK